ncbi:MAG: hypothetical protein WC877_01360 [Dehalococcoidales bacterium]|jgi:hypothetical protein
MLASELIKKLQDEIDESGDWPVYINTMDEEGDEKFGEVLKVETCLDSNDLTPCLIRIMDYYD